MTGIGRGRKVIMIPGTRKAHIAFLSVLLVILLTGCAKADQTESGIEAGNPYIREAINEALDGIPA